MAAPRVPRLSCETLTLHRLSVQFGVGVGDSLHPPHLRFSKSVGKPLLEAPCDKLLAQCLDRSEASRLMAHEREQGQPVMLLGTDIAHRF